MKTNKIDSGLLFLRSALAMLVIGLCFGVFSALIYIFPDFLKNNLGFSSLRPLHVSSVLFWIILGATGCIYKGLEMQSEKKHNPSVALFQWFLWVLAIIGIFSSYFMKRFGGREYWEFEPVWALPVVMAWLLFLFNFVSVVKTLKNWPVYIWMWMTGIVFFLFVFLENYLWVFPYFRSHFITDMTIQWKVNGSIVGAWNQMLYGTLFFLMDKISGTKDTGKNKVAFAMYFLGLFNLMFNWGHHIYTLPTEKYIRYIGYGVSMTEWIFLISIITKWKSTLNTLQKHFHYFPYRFVMAAEVWVFLNLCQAILMSIPAINIYTHGTHVTVAHAMGTTIGINSMILLAACFEFIYFKQNPEVRINKALKGFFWLLQISLLLFWLSLNVAGIQKGLWQLNANQCSYSKMMDGLRPYFLIFAISGLSLLIAFSGLVYFVLRSGVVMKKAENETPQKPLSY